MWDTAQACNHTFLHILHYIACNGHMLPLLCYVQFLQHVFKSQWAFKLSIFTWLASECPYVCGKTYVAYRLWMYMATTLYRAGKDMSAKKWWFERVYQGSRCAISWWNPWFSSTEKLCLLSAINSVILSVQPSALGLSLVNFLQFSNSYSFLFPFLFLFFFFWSKADCSCFVFRQYLFMVMMIFQMTYKICCCPLWTLGERVFQTAVVLSSSETVKNVHTRDIMFTSLVCLFIDRLQTNL